LRRGEQLLEPGRPESGRALAERAYSYSRIGRRAWALAYLAIGENTQALEWLTRVAEKAEAKEGDQGYFATNTIRGNVLNDPVLDQPEFVAVRDRLRIELPAVR
jgi:hypothetical protein